MDPETPQHRAARLWTEMETHCDYLIETYQALVATMIEVGETDGQLAVLIQKKLRDRLPNLSDLFQRVRIRWDFWGSGVLSVLGGQ